VPGRANHVTHPSPLGVPSHQADVKIVEETASRSCTLPRVHTVLDITCIEHSPMSAGQDLSGHCLGTTSSHDHTSVCSTTQLPMRRVPHSPYMSTGREYLDDVCSRTPSLDHTSVRKCKRLRVYRKLATRADHRTNPSANFIGLGLSRRLSSTNLANTLELRPAMPAKPGGSGPTAAKDIKIRHHDDDQQCL
jgi:hypothetical protein